MFKNAGSSEDSILQHNFGDSWVEIEGPNNKKLSPELMKEYILDNPKIKAISSHSAQVTIPKIPGVNIIPIFFFRQPIDRIRSSYEFERIQDSDMPGPIAAKEGDFAHYMAWRLSTPMMTQIVNFHAFRLKDFRVFTTNREAHLFRQRSVFALKNLPVVGLVERFNESMSRYSEIIKPHFPDFEVIPARSNSMNIEDSIADKLKKFEESIGRHTYLNLVILNAIDLELYHFVKKNFWS